MAIRWSVLLRLLFIVIRLLLLVASVSGWIVFFVGFVQLNKRVHSYYSRLDKDFPEYVQHFLTLAHILFIPMWVFVATGPAVYISLGLHVIVLHKNTRHVLHSLFMFFNVFYMFGSSGSLIVALAFSSPKIAQNLQGLVHLDESSAKIVLYGASVAVTTYWISTWLWPLFELRPKEKPSPYAYHQVPQEDEALIASSHVQGTRYYDSGRFGSSRELCQQVSQEYGEYD